jgi:hypothetical protein
VYDHTHIASYRHWGAGSEGQLRIRLLALDGRDAELAGSLSSDPILSGMRRTTNMFFTPLLCEMAMTTSHQMSILKILKSVGVVYSIYT